VATTLGLSPLLSAATQLIPERGVGRVFDLAATLAAALEVGSVARLFFF